MSQPIIPPDRPDLSSLLMTEEPSANYRVLHPRVEFTRVNGSKVALRLVKRTEANVPGLIIYELILNPSHGNFSSHDQVIGKLSCLQKTRGSTRCIYVGGVENSTFLAGVEKIAKIGVSLMEYAFTESLHHQLGGKMFLDADTVSLKNTPYLYWSLDFTPSCELYPVMERTFKQFGRRAKWHDERLVPMSLLSPESIDKWKNRIFSSDLPHESNLRYQLLKERMTDSPASLETVLAQHGSLIIEYMAPNIR